MRKLLVAGLFGLLATGSVFAQTTQPAPTTPPAASKAPATKAPKTSATTARTPESLECSKQADAKGLHGKARKTFRAKCMAQLKQKKAA